MEDSGLTVVEEKRAPVLPWALFAMALAVAAWSLWYAFGRQDRGDVDTIYLGGDEALRGSTATLLSEAGFATQTNGHRFSGTHPQNVCNRGRRGGGVQIELPWSLRETLSSEARHLVAFVDAVRRAITAARNTIPLTQRSRTRAGDIGR